MNVLSPKQIVATQRAGIDMVLGVTQTFLDGFERLADLNWHTEGAMIGETQERVWRGILPRTPLQWMLPSSAWAMPLVEKAQSYCRKAYDIVATTQTDMAGLLREGGDAYVRLFVDEVSKHPASDGDAGVTAWNAMFDASHAMYDAWQKAGLNAAQLATGGFDPAAMVASVSKSAKRGGRQD